jgi:hypothetical protein
VTVHRNLTTSACLLFLILSIGGCASLNAQFFGARELPPILSQDELIRPHTKIGRIQITREVYGIVDPQMTPDIREWGYTAIRNEAAKMGADAVVLPEVSGRSITYLVIPTTEYRATGVAIRFK